jgi:hypothetical protein
MDWDDFVDEHRIFKQYDWAKEAKAAAEAVKGWFCWKRKEKLDKLVKLIRLGSAAHEHGKVKDREALGQVLNEVEDVAIRYL